MPPSDWADDRAYDYFDQLDAAGLAWEALRRNPTYEADYRATIESGDNRVARWGLRFRS